MKNYLLYSLVFLTALAVSSCKTDQSHNTSTKTDSEVVTDRDLALPAWAKSASIYEVNIRQYTPEGTFNAFADHLPRLKKMGVDILWFMPIYPISDTKKKGSLGSYYAVSDFRAVNPAFGTMEDFDNLLQRAHAMDMKVILDWVPNHTGWDHKWLTSNPEYYTTKNGEISDPLDPNTGESWGWTDVADLNYDNKDLHDEMINDLLYWVNEKNIDGFRMDMAHLVPQDFWAKASQALFAANDSLFMLAESEDTDLVNKGYFHAFYGWPFHHIMNDIAKGEKNAKDLIALYNEKMPMVKQGMYMQFTSNHDENSWAGTEYERMGDGAKAFAVLAATFDGIPLIYSGQEEPLKKRLEFFEKDDIGFKDFALAGFYEKLLQLKKRNPALWNREHAVPMKIIGTHDHVLAFIREKDRSKVMVIVNLSDQRQEINIDETVYDLIDIFTGQKMEIPAGSRKGLDPWGYIVATNR